MSPEPKSPAPAPDSLETPLRPILHHLNADTSWLLQIPRPDTEHKRALYNIVIDPWFQGPQSDVAAWFSTQTHLIPSAVKTIAETEKLARQYEKLAASAAGLAEADTDGTVIDAVIISHEFTDHCHKDTLMEVDASVPVFAPPVAAKLMREWKYFKSIIDIEPFKQDAWQGSCSGLPKWLSFSRIEDEKDALYYHSAVVVAFELHDAAECVIYTPHGVAAGALERVLDATPPIETLCFIHGLHDVKLYGMTQLNLGGYNGLKGQRLLQPKYWYATHDEVKKGGGVVALFLKRNVISLDQAVKAEQLEEEDVEKINFAELGSGDMRILV